MKRAIITGISGQDGSYLAEFLLKKGYEVHGIIRRFSNENLERIDHLLEDQIEVHYGDLADWSNLHKLIGKIRPDEIYNLAAQSHVRVSFDQPIYTVDIGAMGVLRLLEVIRYMDKEVKFYQASTSEMFGKAAEVPQNENTKFHPRSPYACAKTYSFHQVVNYREAFGMFGCNGILFNHESPRRGEEFVTRKITIAAAKIKLGIQDKLRMGNLDAKRDWGFAGDYIEAMWAMLQQEKPDDYVVATGETHTVQEFLEQVFAYHELDWKDFYLLDERFLRPAEVNILQGDASKAKKVLGWEPKVKFKELAKMMAEHDLDLVERDIRSRG
jgi:GDPmannose 4,6-dehydratase